MRRLVATIALAAAGLAISAACAFAQTGPTLSSVDWTKTTDAAGTPDVRFHLHWSNPGTAGSTVPVSGFMRSQAFGVFMPDYGPIGNFKVPPLAPGSFFDVFFEVPLSQLPPEPQIILPPNGVPLQTRAPAFGLKPRAQGTPGTATTPCLPDTMWAGNVDMVWSGTGVTGEFVKHYAELQVCPGGAPTYIHVRTTDCPIGAPWSFSGLCSGFTATLVNEDKSPAPNPIPPGWTGWIALGANATVVPGTMCCPILTVTCDGRPAQIELCVTACNCGNPPSTNGPTLGQVDWHTVGTAERFHLRFMNTDALSSTSPASGHLMSQMFGVFQQDAGQIGSFDVPPIQPSSFFDVFLDVPLSSLPPEPLKILPGSGAPFASARGAGRAGGGPTGGDSSCNPDTIWSGNVDVQWTGSGGAGQVNKHFGTLIVCPGGGPSYIHIPLLACPGALVSWSVAGLCPGFSVTLVNEDKSPAPNPLPAGWTGFISTTATAGVVPGTVCCPILTFTCAGVAAQIELCTTACDCGNGHGPTLTQVDWHDLTTGAERFHLRFENPSATAPSVAVSGAMSSQPFGAYQQNFGSIGGFTIPPIMPNSFFDVFFDVALGQLPPEPNHIVPSNPTVGAQCPRDTIWDGNVDIAWNGTGVIGQADKHYGDLFICPGTTPSFIHVHGVACAVGASWSVGGLCPGFGATLVNEDFSPAANPLPAGWTGYIQVNAVAGTASGTVCCFFLTFDCAGAPATLELCATACDCGNASVPGGEQDLGFGIRSTVPNPTAGLVAIVYALPHAAQTRLEVYDAGGRRVRTLAGGMLTAGRHTTLWDGRGASGEALPGGQYFVRLSIDGRTNSRRITLLR